MKRKDWKIKKLRKDIYGKKIKKRRKTYLLRELNLRKYNVFLNKDLIPQYKYYKKLNNFFSLKNNYINNIYFYNNYKNKYYILFPNFFFKKKIFNYFNHFENFLHDHNFNYIFLKGLSKGNNILLFNNKDSRINTKLFEDEIILKIFSYKYILGENKSLLENNFNFFINYNIFFKNLVEIYKILIILYINKLK